MPRQSRSKLLQAAALAIASSATATYAQSIQQPTANDTFTAFSGQGAVPFSYSPSEGVSSINLAVSFGDAGEQFAIANGLQSSSSNGNGDINAVFAPIGGWCGEVALSVTENQGNSTSSESSSVNFNVVCGPVQRKRNSIPLLQPLSKRQESGGGPSGSLNTPTGGTSYTSPEDSINIVYQPVTEGGQTFGIDAALTSDFGNYTLVNGLWKSNDSSTISARFAIPSGACGPFNLVITEHQFYQNGAVAFQAAAPSINITCSSGSDGGNTNATAPAANSTVPISTSTSANATSTSANATSTATSSRLPLSFTGNITLPISTETITRPTTIVDTVTQTFTQSGETGTVTSIITTTVSPSSTSTSSDSTTASNTSTSSNSTTTSESTSTSSDTSESSNGGGGGGGGIRTTTVTATPSSRGGLTTVTVTPRTSLSSDASQSVTPRTSTYTTTEVVVVAAPGKSSITSTRLQTVVLISQTIAAIVAPSSAGSGNSGQNQGGSGGGNSAASPGMILAPWSLSVAVGLATVLLFHQRAR